MDQVNLAKLAVKALENYKQNVVSCTFFAKETSTVYKVTNDKNQDFALKIHDQEFTNLEDSIIEIQILEAIRKDGAIQTAELIQNKGGHPVTIYSDPSSEKTYRITLTKWLKGVNFKGNETEQIFFELGKTVAQLHNITKNIVLPEKVTPKAWNQVFYFRNESAVYHDPIHKNKFSDEFVEVMDTAVPILNQQLKRIYDSEKPILLHGDLNPWNIKIQNKQLAIFDFEDAIFGPPIHDLAILFYYYRQNPDFGYEHVKEHVLKGYAEFNEIKDFSDKDIETLIMARNANFLNYVLTLEGDYKDYIAKGLTKLKAYLNA
ncbi:MAG: phosphotransferase [Bacteroidota bacterium]